MKEKNTEISARVAELIEKMGETPNSFAKALGYARAQTIYDIMSGKSAPSYDFFKKIAIAEISANINIYWLLTGEGNMYKRNEENVVSTDFAAPNSADTSLFIEKIAEQATEIGRLKERISRLELEKERLASAARTSSAANVG